MVSIFITGLKWADREKQMKNFCDDLETLRTQALELANEDAKDAAKKTGAISRCPELWARLLLQSCSSTRLWPPAHGPYKKT
jgi:hypothetical protein